MATDDQNDMYPSDGMDETTASADTSSSGDDSQANGSDSQEEGMEGETFLAPKSALGGDYKVGDTCTFKIVHLYDGEAELQPVKDSDEDNETMDGAMSKMDSMATDGEM